MKTLLVTATILLLLQNVVIWAEPAWQEVRVADFSNEHSIETLTNSNVLYSEDAGRDYGRGFFLKKQNIIVRFPGGREIQQKIEDGSAEATETDLLALALNGPILPTEEAYLIATVLHQSLGLSMQPLKVWYETNKDKGRDSKSYIAGNTKLYPTIGISIRPSMNELYPWYIRLTVGWNLTRHKDWNEAKAAVENQPPPPGLERVTLDSPSGTVYERTQAYQHLAEKASANRQITPTPDQEPSTPLALRISTPEPAPDSESTETKDQKWPLIIAALLGVVILVIAFCSYRRKSE